jgi:hypothetical protein
VSRLTGLTLSTACAKPDRPCTPSPFLLCFGSRADARALQISHRFSLAPWFSFFEPHCHPKEITEFGWSTTAAAHPRWALPSDRFSLISFGPYPLSSPWCCRTISVSPPTIGRPSLEHHWSQSPLPPHRGPLSSVSSRRQNLVRHDPLDPIPTPAKTTRSSNHRFTAAVPLSVWPRRGDHSVGAPHRAGIAGRS